MTRETEKCPLSVLTGVRIKRVNFQKKIYRRNCPPHTGVCIKRMSVERGPTLVNNCSFSLYTTTSLEVIQGLLLCLPADNEAYVDRSRVRSKIKDWPSMLGDLASSVSTTIQSHPKN